MRTQLRVVFVLLALVCAATAAEKPTQNDVPNLSGYWKLDPINSTASAADMQASFVNIRQSSDEIDFDYRGGTRSLGEETIYLDGRSHVRYKTHIETAFARAKFRKGVLVITTEHSLSNYSSQGYTETEEWSLLPDGHTLTHKLTDGKKVVYTKVPEEQVQP